MANLLILNITTPYPLHHNGNTVRVLPLSRELAKHHRCFLAVFDEADERYRELAARHEYEDILLLPPFPTRHPWWRYFFWRTGNLFKRLHPGYYRDCVAKLTAFASRHNIDLVLAHTLVASEFAEELPVAHKIVDAVDCRYLYLERLFANTPPANKLLFERIKANRQLARARYQESGLLRHFSLVTTISPRDRAVLKVLTRDQDDRVVDIPNGVAVELEQWQDEGTVPGRSIAFWGALDFPPNATAVAYFYQQIFLPYLSKENVVWYIIGRNPGHEIQALAQRHDNITVTGYVPDLFALVRDIPVVVNPMLIGGGLKNKVLEAFAMQRAVVSNALGMEAIDAIPGEHYIAAETPAEFAKQILELLADTARAHSIGCAARNLVLECYTWRAVGQKMQDLIERVLR